MMSALSHAFVIGVLIGLAIMLVRLGLIQAVAEIVIRVLAFPFELAGDIRRNGASVLKAIFGWSVAIGALVLFVTAFKISF
jgi:hypothetical protein